MQEKKKMYRAIHRTANAGFDIWFVCAKNKIEARKIIIDGRRKPRPGLPSGKGCCKQSDPEQLVVRRSEGNCTRA